MNNYCDDTVTLTGDAVATSWVYSVVIVSSGTGNYPDYAEFMRSFRSADARKKEQLRKQREQWRLDRKSVGSRKSQLRRGRR